MNQTTGLCTFDDVIWVGLLQHALSMKVTTNHLANDLLGRALAALGEAKPISPPAASGNPIALAEALDIAFKRLSERESPEPFTTDDLFDRTEWARLQTRNVFGRMFRQRGEAAGLVEWIGKSPDHRAIYRRLFPN